MLATISATWLSFATSQIIAWVSGSSRSRARIRSGERARAITRNPPVAKRRTIADPVPGPTPVTIAIGLLVTDPASPKYPPTSFETPWTRAGPLAPPTLDDYRHIKQPG